MTLVRLLLAQMDVHDAGAGVKRSLLARHLVRRHRHVMLPRISEHAVQRAGNDRLIAHDTRSFADA
jgi:hypothetical protein